MSCLISTFSISHIVPNIQAFAEAAGSAGYIFDVISRVISADFFRLRSFVLFIRRRKLMHSEMKVKNQELLSVILN
jgi:hypothetical protein